MPLASPPRMLLLALLTVGCARPTADTHAPDLPGPAPALAVSSPIVADDDPAPGTVERPDAQTISFADDADPEPATQIQGAPKRPPLPRFRLFGTRDHDGPN